MKRTNAVIPAKAGIHRPVSPPAGAGGPVAGGSVAGHDGKYGLPPGWIWATLGQVCDKAQYGWTTSATESSGNLKFLRTTDLTSGLVDWKSVPHCKDNPPDPAKYRLSDGDIVISRAGSVGFSWLVRNAPEAVFASYLIRFRPTKQVEPAYLAYFLQSPMYWAEIGKRASGIALRNVNAKKLSSIELPLAPLPEQRRIVAELEKHFTRLDAAVAALKRIQAHLKRYRAAVLKAACEGFLPRDAGDRSLKNRNWRSTTLGEVVSSMKNGIYKPRSSYADSGIPCLRMYNIEDGRIVWRDIKRMALTREEITEYQLLPGDRLVNRVNSRELVGKAAAVPEGLEPCVFESKNIRVRLNRDLADARFVGYVIFVYGQRHFNRNAQQVVGMASISQPQVSALRLPLPPLGEQRKIVVEIERRLRILEKLRLLVAANIERAARLRQGILRTAFEGRLVENGRG